MRWPSRESLLLFLAAAVFAVRVALALLVVPPWQQPDEPQNVALIRLLREAGSTRPLDDLILRYRGGTRDDPATEPLIVASMAEHRWWQHYGRPSPNPPPETFAAAGEVVGADFGLPGGGMTYFQVFAFLFRLFHIDEVLSQLYALRVFSALCGLLTLCAAWAACRAAFGADAAAIVAAVLALHPQFLLVSTAANPDAAVNMFGALTWYFAVRLSAGTAVLRDVIGVIAAAVAASFVKRVGVPLLGGAAIAVTFFSGRPVRQTVKLAIVVAAGIAVVAVLLNAFAPEEFNRVVASTRFIDQRWVLSGGSSQLARLWSFICGLLASGYLYAGWLQYPAPNALTVAVYAVAFAGLAMTIAAYRRSSDAQRRALQLAGVFVVLQLIATFAVHFPIGGGAQGRYLFPVIAPLLTLSMVGFAMTPARGQNLRPTLVVLFAVACDVIGWTTVLIPAYV